MKENEISQFKYNFLNLRWLIVIAAGYMAVFSAEHSVFTEVNYINALVLFFILSNIFLYFLSPEFFKSRNFRYFVFLGDIVFVTLAIYLTKSGSTDFFLLYFLVIVITALGKDLKASIIATVVASLLYFWIIMKKDADVNLYDANIYMRIPFLFVVGLFTGFLSETVKKEESHVKDLRLILAITDVVNENMDYNVMVKLLEPFFKKMEVVSDWEIGVFNENTATFKLLRAGTEVVARDLEPEIVERLINKSEVYRGERYIYFPQTREKKASGFLRIEPVSFEKFFSQDQDLFMTLAGEFAIALERDRLYEQIKNLANSDRLTELYNYGYFLEQADNKIAENRDFAVIMIDLDNFKAYNDTYGHMSGNIYLRKLAGILKREFKDCLLARYGGDEFVVLREGNNEDLPGFLENIKSSTDAEFTGYMDRVKVTMSIGYAYYPKDGKSAEEVIVVADQGLYKAKQTGKNKIAYLN